MEFYLPRCFVIRGNKAKQRNPELFIFSLDLWLWRYHVLTISYLNVCFQTLDPLNSSSLDNFDENIFNNCISNLYIHAKLVTSILQMFQTKFISSLVQENIFGVLTSSKISHRSLGVKWLNMKHNQPKWSMS